MTLSIRDVSKRFGPVQANRGVSFEVPAGSLHAVLGENGAGKSTLMKILSGFQDADSGEIVFEGTRLRLGSPRAAIAAGVGMLHQDPLVALPFTVLENFVFGHGGRLDRRQAREELEKTSDRLGFQLDPDRVTRTLTVGERQQLEIVRLLSLGVRVLILDEPTSGISKNQREALFTALQSLAADGLIVLFVSHKLEEVEELCSGVTVMRRGRVVGSEEVPAPPGRLVEMMFGREVSIAAAGAHTLGETVLSLSGVSALDGNRTIEGVTLDVKAGEVIGLAGMAGSGQRVILRAIAGLSKVTAGTLRFGGSDLASVTQRRRREMGIHYLAAGRLEEGLFEGLTITEHLELALSRERGAIDWELAESRAASSIDGYRIKGEPGTAVESLSGGNQQRVLLAMMPDDLEVLLMEQPTRGLDIESADEIWRSILARRDSGTAVIFASADLEELIRNSDRIAVCFNAEVIAVLDAAGLDTDRLGSLIGGLRDEG